jgi:methylase of polypeptide subunit release factors
VDLLAPKPGERILDLGCGDGVLTKKLADLRCEVVAVDSSVLQIEAVWESSPDLQLRTLPCYSVTLPTLWNSRRESNPDLLIRQSKVGPKRHGQYFQSGFRQHDRQLTVQW